MARLTPWLLAMMLVSGRCRHCRGIGSESGEGEGLSGW